MPSLDLHPRVKEIQGERRDYAPYYGRGLIQLTHLGNYRGYGRFRAINGTLPATDPFHELGWNPDNLLARTDAEFSADHCAESGAWYWTNPGINALHVNGNRLADAGTDLAHIIQTSRLTNGNVQVKDINGLDIRAGNIVFLKHVLLDTVKTAETETLAFQWRNHLRTGPFALADYLLEVPLTPQRL